MNPPKPSEPWYFRTSAIVIAFLCVGPLALPMVWFHPRYSVLKKTVVTAVSLALTYVLTLYTIDAVKKILEYYKQLSGTL